MRSSRIHKRFGFGIESKRQSQIDSEARRQATHIVEAQVSPGTAPAGTKFTVVVAVDETAVRF